MVQRIKGSAFPWKAQARDHNGRVVSKQFARKEDAERFEAKIRDTRQLVRGGLEAPKSDIILIDYFKHWMQARVKSVPRSTWEMDDSRFRNHVAEKFGARAMATISSAEWREHLDELMHREEKPLAKASRNRVRALLHKLYEDAFMAEKVVFNPLSKIPLLEESIKLRRTIWTQAQYDAYIAAAYDISPYVGLFAEISLFEGLRISETLALTFGDFDEEAGCIWITKIYEQESHEIVARTKGDEAGRRMPLFPRVAQAVARHKGIHPMKGRDAYIFGTDTGHPINPFAMRRLHERAVAAAKVPRLTPHGLRHTFASIAQMAGFTSAELKEMLGHSTILMTEKYTHMQMEHLVKKGQALGFGAASQKVLRLKRR